MAGDWGSDSSGTHEPFTVLSPDGTATSPDVVVVSITGFEGYQGGLDQASAGYLAEEREDITLGGRRARYTPPTSEPAGVRWADLVVEVGEDLAVRLTSPTGSLDRLRSVFDRVELPEDRTRPPAVTTPEGLRLVGSVSVDAVLALNMAVAQNSDAVPGSSSSHGAGWVAASGRVAQLVVVSLPGGTVDLDALPASAAWTRWFQEPWRRRSVHGQPGLVHESVDTATSGPEWRSVWTESAWGDVIVVASNGSDLLDEDELVAVAESVRKADEREWAAFVIEATGGPGLHPDEGRTELARGVVGDVEWLLQTGPPGGGLVLGSDIDPSSTRGVDACLKLSTRRRACAATGGGGVDDWIMSTPGDEGLSFVVISTTMPAVSVRVTGPDEETTVPLVPVPGGGLWGAVAFVDAPGMAVCPTPEPLPPSMEGDTIIVEALDASGAVIGCLGLGGEPRPPG